MKNRKIHRPGVRGLTAQNETGKCTGIGVSVPVPFFFPEMNPKCVKPLVNRELSHILPHDWKSVPGAEAGQLSNSRSTAD